MVRFVIAVAMLSCAWRTAAQPCQLEWANAFTGDSPPGDVTAMATYDDGHGPALWIASENAADRKGWISTYDGVRIRIIGEFSGSVYANPYFDVTVSAFAEHDDGSGRALYLGGNFTHIDGVECGGLARYRDGHWERAGQADGQVRALLSHDTGAGRVLLAAGHFRHMDGRPASGLAVWDGAAWSEFGGGLHSTDRDTQGLALVVWDDGVASSLYVGGLFDHAGDLQTHNIARWDGNRWWSLGDGLHTLEFKGDVRGLIGHVDDHGQRWLFAHGEFTRSGQTLARRMARWDGTAWHDGSEGLNNSVWPMHAMATYSIGGVERLYGGGIHVHFGQSNGLGLFEWQDEAWVRVAETGGRNDGTYFASLHPFASSHGDHLYLGGRIHTFDGVPIINLGRWNGSEISLVPSTHAASVTRPRLSVGFDVHSPQLFLSGGFTGIAGQNIEHIAAFDGQSWSQVPLNGLIAPQNVEHVVSWDDGSGPALYAIGLRIASGAPLTTTNAARFRHGAWEAIPAGVSILHGLVPFDDGRGTRLFGYSSAHLASGWNGQSWTPPGNVTAHPFFGQTVAGIFVIQEAAGQALYVAGNFSLYESPPRSFALARFRSGHTQWEYFAPPGDGWVYAACSGGPPNQPVVFLHTSTSRYETGRAMYAFENDQWTAIPGVQQDLRIRAMTWWDHGSGGALYIFGDFTNVGGVPAHGAAKWADGVWTGVDGGDSIEVRSTPVSFPMQGRNSLWLPGSIITNRHVDGNLAILQGCHTCYPDCDESTGQGVLDIFDFLCFANRFAVSDPYACDCDLTTGPGVCDLLDFLCFGNAFTAGCS